MGIWQNYECHIVVHQFKHRFFNSFELTWCSDIYWTLEQTVMDANHCCVWNQKIKKNKKISENRGTMVIGITSYIIYISVKNLIYPTSHLLPYIYKKKSKKYIKKLLLDDFTNVCLPQLGRTQLKIWNIYI